MIPFEEFALARATAKARGNREHHPLKSSHILGVAGPSEPSDASPKPPRTLHRNVVRMEILNNCKAKVRRCSICRGGLADQASASLLAGEQFAAVARQIRKCRKTLRAHINLCLPAEMAARFLAARRPCPICADPIIRERADLALRDGRGVRVAATTSGATYWQTYHHLRRCCGDDLRRHVRRGRPKKENETDEPDSTRAAVNEARALFGVVGFLGQTVATVRESIGVSKTEEQLLREKDPQQAERIVAFRTRVLREFDRIAAEPTAIEAAFRERRATLAIALERTERLHRIAKARWEARHRRAEAQR